MTQQRHALIDAQWQRMVVHLPPVLGRPGRDDRLFIDAVLWIAKTCSPWRDLPVHLGAWAQVYQRFARWSERGHFRALFLAFQEPDHEQLMVDSTSCKAHQASAGAQKKMDLKRLASLAAD
ncbi:putative transposase [Polaromonas sp. CG_9.5]|uniref:transposase n=1 Tax=Polaromonas sp. CG_9.5 TaxID=3071705 RepID=UPI002E05D201|nr:putative transposase [Polaromonas sp. CG_9.5]